MRNFSKRLIIHETRGNKSSEPNNAVDFRVCEKLRPALATLMGNAGYRALLSRALVLSGAEIPWLRAVHVKADGSLEGLDELAAQLGPDEFFEGKVALLAELLGLLSAFIGENLTLQLVREAWPKVTLDESDFSKGGKNEKAK
jgi:hypothetical protein